MSETQGSDQRTIGRLEGILQGLQSSLNTVLKNQDSADLKFDQHADEDRRNLRDVMEGLGGLRDRVTRTEAISDAVESHGDAILTIEKWMEQQKSIKEKDQALHQNNIKWIAAAGGAGIIVGTSGSSLWLKIWLGVLGLFK